MSGMHGRTVFLSQTERRTGARRFIRFSGMNGLGISLLGDTPVYLMAVYFGATNLQLGLISSMIHVSGIALLVIPRIFRGRNVVTVGFWSWIVRGALGLGYLGILRLQGRAAVALVMGIYGLFCLSRTVGVSMVSTVQKRLTVSRTQGDLVFRNSASFQISALLSRVISFLVFSIGRMAELTGLVALPMLGILANTIAAFFYRSIPNRTLVESGEHGHLGDIFLRAVKDPEKRRVLGIRWISLSQGILFGMAVPFLRRAVGVSPKGTFLYAMAGGAAAWLASVVMRPVVERAGSRPLLFWSSAGSFCVLAAWGFVPETLSLGPYAALGFAGAFLLVTAQLASSRLLIRITPEDGAVGFNSMETFVTSLIALALGFVAGGLVDLSAALRPVTPLNSFALVFLAAAAGSAAQAVLAAGMDEPGSLGLWETARNVLDTDTLRTWRAVSALESTENPVKKQTVLYSLGYSRAPAAAGEIRRIMAEPLSREKGELIDALFHTRRPELEGDLRKEAADRWAYHRVRAVFALGAYPGEENEALLARLLDDGEPLVRSAAAKSLARLGAEFCREKVTAMAKGAVSVLERLDYLIALFHYDAERAFLSDLFSPATAALGESLEKPLHSLLARLFGMTPPLAALYREEALRPGGGLEILLEEARETAFLLDRGDRVAAAWAAGDFPAVWGICRTALAWAEPPGDLAPLGRAIAAFPPGSASRINALAALYYTYQILTAQEAS